MLNWLHTYTSLLRRLRDPTIVFLVSIGVWAEISLACSQKRSHLSSRVYNMHTISDIRLLIIIARLRNRAWLATLRQQNVESWFDFERVGKSEVEEQELDCFRTLTMSIEACDLAAMLVSLYFRIHIFCYFISSITSTIRRHNWSALVAFRQVKTVLNQRTYIHFTV